MKSGHVRRTKSPTHRHQWAKRGVWLASLAFPLLVPVIGYLLIPKPPDGIDEIKRQVQQADFDPMMPPTRLRGPGALYQVEGHFYYKVCDAGPELLQGKVKSSPTLQEFRGRSENAGFSLRGNLINSVNANLSDARVSSLEYRLTDVEISEIALSDLGEIRDKLLQQKECDRIVDRLLKDHKQVCAGYAALSATMSFKVTFDAAIRADTAALMPAVQHAIEHTQGRLQLRDRDELSGENLIYGIKLEHQCITLNTATDPSVLTNPDVPQPAIPRNGT
jgi:hypothetical protein